MAAASLAQRNPPSLTTKPTGESDFTKWSFDPLRTQVGAYLANLQQEQVLFKGDPPQPRVRLKSMALNAKPYPSVELIDCLVIPSSWRAYEAKTGKPVPFATPTSPLPKGSSVELIYYEGHWGVQKISGDLSIKCAE